MLSLSRHIALLFIISGFAIFSLSCNVNVKPRINKNLVSPISQTQDSTELSDSSEYIPDITPKIRQNVIYMLQHAIEFASSEEMDSIKKMSDVSAGEKVLLQKMDSIAKRFGFENFIEANRIRMNLMTDSVVVELMNRLDQLSKK